MLSSLNSRIPALVLAALLLALVAAGGCVADTAADSDLPWATNQSWEGVMPIPGSVLHQYD